MAIMRSKFWRHFIKCGFLVFFLLDFPVIFAGRLSGFHFHNHGHGHGHPRRGAGGVLDLCDTPEGMSGECHPLTHCWAAEYENYELEPCEMQSGHQEHFCCPDRTAENIRVVSPGRHHPRPPQPPLKPTDKPHVGNPMQGFIETVLKPVVDWWNPPGSKDERVTAKPQKEGDRHASSTSRPVTRATHRPGHTWSTRVPEPGRSTRTTRRQVFTPTTTPIRRTTTRRNVVQPVFQTSCGQKGSGTDELLDEREIASFVIGGTDAEEHAWPWMVSIHSSRNGAKSRFICGGSLITTSHVLTAAHCFENQNQGTRYLVNFGSNNLTPAGQNSLNHGQLPVIHIKMHEQYVPKVHYYDIAVLTLSDDVIFSDDVSPICLPTTQELQKVTARAKVTLTGWGHTSFGGVPSSRLQEVQLQIIPLSRCQNSYDNFTSEALYEGVTTNMLCAGSPEGGMDACQGDSGGPLVMQTGQRWIQIGVVSFGYRCGVKDFPGVYTRISSYLRWINRVLTEQ